MQRALFTRFINIFGANSTLIEIHGNPSDQFANKSLCVWRLFHKFIHPSHSFAWSYWTNNLWKFINTHKFATWAFEHLLQLAYKYCFWEIVGNCLRFNTFCLKYKAFWEYWPCWRFDLKLWRWVSWEEFLSVFFG